MSLYKKIEYLQKLRAKYNALSNELFLLEKEFSRLQNNTNMKNDTGVLISLERELEDLKKEEKRLLTILYQIRDMFKRLDKVF